MEPEYKKEPDPMPADTDAASSADLWTAEQDEQDIEDILLLVAAVLS